MHEHLCDSAFSALITFVTIVMIWKWYIKLLDAHNLLHVFANISMSIDTVFEWWNMWLFNQNIYEHTLTLSFYLTNCVQEEEIETRRGNAQLPYAFQRSFSQPMDVFLWIYKSNVTHEMSHGLTKRTQDSFRIYILHCEKHLYSSSSSSSSVRHWRIEFQTRFKIRDKEKQINKQNNTNMKEKKKQMFN